MIPVEEPLEFFIGLILEKKLIRPSYDLIWNPFKLKLESYDLTYQPSEKFWQNISLHQELSRLVLDWEFQNLGCD